MRWALALALVCSVAACRRSAQPPEPAAETAAAAPATAPADPAPTAETRAAEAPSEPAPAPATVAAAPAPAAQPTTEKLPVADVPPPASPPPANPDESDHRIYTWVGDDGSVHYGTADDVPAGYRKSARVVDTGVTVVSPEPVGDVPTTTSATAAAPASTAAEQPGKGTRRGAQPELDAQGLPIPGTMDDTAATRAAKAAGETQIDPAAVERRRQEELRRMNCKEKDGVWTCG